MTTYDTQSWMDAKHGRVTKSGLYNGCLLRGGERSGCLYLDILLPSGWQRLDQLSTEAEDSDRTLEDLKDRLERWFQAC